MRVYFGVRGKSGCEVYWWDTSDPQRPQLLPWCLELWNHSPTGLEWGHCGSGPAQCALALLHHITGDVDFSVSMHQALKFHTISKLDKNIWARTEEDILAEAYASARTQESAEQCRTYLIKCRVANGKKEVNRNA